MNKAPLIDRSTSIRESLAAIERKAQSLTKSQDTSSTHTSEVKASLQSDIAALEYDLVQQKIFQRHTLALYGGFEFVSTFDSEGFAVAKKWDQEGFLRSYYIDRKGNIIGGPYYDAKPFSDGIGLVQKSGGWWYIDRNQMNRSGPHQLEATGPFDNGLAIIVERNLDRYQIVNTQFQTLLANPVPHRPNLSEGIATYDRPTHRVINNKDTTVTYQTILNCTVQPPRTTETLYTYIGSFVNGKAPARDGAGTWQYIDADGKAVAAYDGVCHTYAYASNIVENCGVVEDTDGRWHIIDRDEQKLTGPFITHGDAFFKLFPYSRDISGWRNSDGSALFRKDKPQHLHINPSLFGMINQIVEGTTILKRHTGVGVSPIEYYFIPAHEVRDPLQPRGPYTFIDPPVEGVMRVKKGKDSYYIDLHENTLFK